MADITNNISTVVPQRVHTTVCWFAANLRTCTRMPRGRRLVWVEGFRERSETQTNYVGDSPNPVVALYQTAIGSGGVAGANG